ncbi:MAG: four helix bundle protein [Holophagaceae bacterium]|nr:four helix bundle protein [Holophagaceae bacterium]
MYRDPKELKVFAVADGLAFELHQAGRHWAREEFGSLVAVLQRAALAPVLHILEACRQPRDEGFTTGLRAAKRSAEETRYLVDLGLRVGLLPEPEAKALEEQALHLVKSLAWLLRFQKERELRKAEEASREPEAQG